MKLVRISMLTGKETSREVDVTEEQILAWLAGGLIQDVMPNLSADDREFVMTGITPEEWETAFGGDDVEEVEL